MACARRAAGRAIRPPAWRSSSRRRGYRGKFARDMLADSL